MRIWPGEPVPLLTAFDDPDSLTGLELGLKFRASRQGQVLGLHFYKGAGTANAHIGRLYTIGGVLLGELTFAGETSTGWQYQAFPSPIPIEANTVYVASYLQTDGHFALDNGYFTSAGVDSGLLRALAAGESGDNGVFLYAVGGGFPVNSFGHSNYWIDPEFEQTYVSDSPTPFDSPGAEIDPGEETVMRFLTVTQSETFTLPKGWVLRAAGVGEMHYQMHYLQAHAKLPATFKTHGPFPVDRLFRIDAHGDVQYQIINLQGISQADLDNLTTLPIGTAATRASGLTWTRLYWNGTAWAAL